MRQNPVGEPAATAALNFGTPRRRSSWKRLGPFCHCRQRYRRSLRRNPCLQVGEHPWGLAEAKVPAPSEEVWRQLLDQLRQTDSPCSAGHVSDLRLELAEGFGRDVPFAPVIRDAESQELALLRSRHRAFRLVDLQPQLSGQEPAHRSHDPFTGTAAANIDIAVVGIPAETVTPSLQLLVEIVEHEIA